ncbi:class I SAM-dependent methyltransferase [bacterium]|nr:class I SAM-dependent methyltransferase [bacterium]
MKYAKLKKKSGDLLVFINKAANEEFWENRWNGASDWVESISSSVSSRSPLVRRIVKVLNPRATILEGGCGRGEILYKLDSLEFNVIGVDYAEKTVKKLKKFHPHLDVRVGNVFDLSEFSDDSFDAYYSGGVIEHFWDGYHPISAEMARLIKSGGYLFITFPFMSRFRRKFVKGLKNVHNNNCPPGFYQFALPINEVVSHFSELGFRLESKLLRNGCRGLSDAYPDSELLRKTVRWNPRGPLAKAFRHLISMLLAYCGFGHTCLLVLKKR